MQVSDFLQVKQLMMKTVEARGIHYLLAEALELLSILN